MYVCMHAYMNREQCLHFIQEPDLHMIREQGQYVPRSGSQPDWPPSYPLRAAGCSNTSSGGEGGA